MAVLYLQPEDLSPAQAARVLDFLNRATSAAEIAARVEFAGELDIGVQLGQRLLNARTALGGTYTDLQQVDAVPLIGPERFTELCAALLGLDPRRWLQDFSLFAQRKLQIADGFAQLQEQLAALEASTERVQLDLTASPQPAWLGQALQLTVSVRDLRGRPLPNRQLTGEASVGTLEAAYGFAVQRARGVTVRTGADGTARLRLRFTTIEPLTADQRAALEDALGQLDAGADSPNLLRDAFLGIAAAYQEERRNALRGVLDIYARQWKAQFFDQLNPSNLGFNWPLETCVVRADCHPEDGGATGLATAVLVVHWKNWVGAWFEFLGEYLAQKAKLSAAFSKAKGRGASGYRLVDDLLGEAHSFVANQKGLAAEWLSQRVVKYAVNDFLGREVDNLDDVTQRELFSNLEAAASQLTASNRGAIAMVNQTRVVLDDKITKVGSINADVLGEIRGLHADMLARATLVDNELAAFNATKAQLDTRLDQFDSRYQIFTTQYADFGQRYTTFNANYNTFTTSYNTFTANYNTFNTNFAGFNQNLQGFNQNLQGFNQNLQGFNQRVQGFNQNVQVFNQNYAKFNTDYSDFRNRYDNIGGRLNTFDQNFATFNTRYTQFNTDLANFQTQRTALAQDVSAMRTELNAVQADVGAVKTDVAAVKTDLGRVRTDVTAVETDLGTVRTDVTAVRTDLGTVKQNVNTINTRLPPGTGRIG
jgi:archaellum component FlaC